MSESVSQSVSRVVCIKSFFFFILLIRLLSYSLPRIV